MSTYTVKWPSVWIKKNRKGKYWTSSIKRVEKKKVKHFKPSVIVDLYVEPKLSDEKKKRILAKMSPKLRARMDENLKFRYNYEI